MNEIHRLDVAIRTSLGLTDDVDLASAAYGRTEGWDSVAHMKMIAAVEDAFDIMIDTDDVIAMSDYPTVRRILRSPYGVALDA